MKPVPIAYYEGDLQGSEAVLASQGWIGELRPGRPVSGAYVSASASRIDIHLPVEGLVDTEKELARIAKEETKLAEESTKLSIRLSDPVFAERAKPEVVEREKNRLVEIESQLHKLAERKVLFGG